MARSKGKATDIAHIPTTRTDGWLRRSMAEVRTAFIEDRAERRFLALSNRRKMRQSSRDVVELAAISVALFAAGLAAVWSTTL